MFYNYGIHSRVSIRQRRRLAYLNVRPYLQSKQRSVFSLLVNVKWNRKDTTCFLLASVFGTRKITQPLKPICKRAQDDKTYLELTTNHLEFIDIVCQLNYAQYTSRIQFNEAEKYVACHQSLFIDNLYLFYPYSAVRILD